MLLVLKKIIGPLTINNNIITWHLRFCKIDTSTLMLNVKNRVKNIATLQTAFLFFLLQSVILFFMSDLFTYLTDLTVVVAVTRHRDQRYGALLVPYTRTILFFFWRTLSWQEPSFSRRDFCFSGATFVFLARLLFFRRDFCFSGATFFPRRDFFLTARLLFLWRDFFFSARLFLPARLFPRRGATFLAGAHL